MMRGTGPHLVNHSSTARGPLAIPLPQECKADREIYGSCNFLWLNAVYSYLCLCVEVEHQDAYDRADPSCELIKAVQSHARTLKFLQAFQSKRREDGTPNMTTSLSSLHVRHFYPRKNVWGK